MLPVTLKDGSKRELWCTFGPEQIDININSPKGAHGLILGESQKYEEA